MAGVGHDEPQRRTCSHGADGWKHLFQLDRVEAKCADVVNKVERGTQVGWVDMIPFQPGNEYLHAPTCISAFMATVPPQVALTPLPEVALPVYRSPANSTEEPRAQVVQVCS